MLGAGPGTYVPPTAMGVAKHLDELRRCVMTSLDGVRKFQKFSSHVFVLQRFKNYQNG